MCVLYVPCVVCVCVCDVWNVCNGTLRRVRAHIEPRPELSGCACHVAGVRAVLRRQEVVVRIIVLGVDYRPRTYAMYGVYVVHVVYVI